MDICVLSAFEALPAKRFLVVTEHSEHRDISTLSGASQKFNSVCGPDPFAINNAVILDFKSPFNKTWDVFAGLTHDQTLDLAWLSRDLLVPLIHSIPPSLFPDATTVRLAGVMMYTLTASILLMNAQKPFALGPRQSSTKRNKT